MPKLLPVILSGSLLVAGCGGSSEDNGATRSTSLKTELLSRVSAAVVAGEESGYESLDEVAYVDFVRAREQLGMVPEADVYQRSGRGRSERTSLLASLADRALLYPGRLPTTLTPLAQAIDGGAIKASASVAVLSGPPSALVIETSQPFDEISAALRKRGYVRDGDLLVTDRPTGKVTYPVVAEAGRGVVVAAGSEEAARAALAGRDAKLTRAAELIGDVPGVARAASARRSRCILARAAGQNLAPQQRNAPQRGEYVVVIDGTADATKLAVAGQTLPGGLGNLIFGEAKAEEDRVRVRFRDEDPLNATFLNIVNDDVLTSATELKSPYTC